MNYVTVMPANAGIQRIRGGMLNPVKFLFPVELKKSALRALMSLGRF